MTRNLLVLATLCFIILSCNQAPKAPKAPEVKKPSTGTEHNIITSMGGTKVVAGDEVFFKMVGKVGDSTFFNTYAQKSHPYYRVVIKEPVVPNNFEDCLTKLGAGDSAIFKIDADSFFIVNTGGRGAPDFVKDGEKLVCYIKIDSIIPNPIDVYIKQTGKSYTRTSSGLRYLITQTSSGEQAKKGDMVSAYYKGSLLNGQVFDFTDAQKGAFQFQLGVHQVIAGWDEIFAILKVGEKATIIIPSYLGYGEQGSPPKIPGNAPLIFDVELLKITKGRN